jgi:hypothetical protein
VNRGAIVSTLIAGPDTVAAKIETGTLVDTLRDFGRHGPPKSLYFARNLASIRRAD